MHNLLNQQIIDLPELITEARQLPKEGKLMQADSQYFFLKIDDRYIHLLFPYLFAYNNIITKPNYFISQNNLGAHITVIYPEEAILVDEKDLGLIMTFSIQGLFSADILTKRYFALAVESSGLIALRKKYGLTEQLSFKQYKIPLHITLGVHYIN